MERLKPDHHLDHADLKCGFLNSFGWSWFLIQEVKIGAFKDSLDLAMKLPAHLHLHGWVAGFPRLP